MLDEGMAQDSPVSARKLAHLRQITLTVYVLYAVAPLTAGLSALLAIGINHTNRRSMLGTPFDEHFAWQIQLFWRSLLWLLVGYFTVWFHYVGLVVLLLGFGWYLYRLVRGIFCFIKGRPLPHQVSPSS
jgi:uncharacterized membrane protein